MNYSKHYDLLIERARNRLLEVYTERHHIIPRCIGGADSADNLVDLTPEEHYVAHQLLVKIYPDNRKLIYAMNMMTVESGNQNRSMNKRYGWIKRKYIAECRKRIGKENPSYGKSWYHNPDTLENGKFPSSNIPEGWVKGRKYKQIKNKNCEICGIETHSPRAKYCDEHRYKSASHEKQIRYCITCDTEIARPAALYCDEHRPTSDYKKMAESVKAKNKQRDFDKFTHAITTSYTWAEAIRKAGYKTDGYSRARLQNFAKEENIFLAQK